MGRSSVRGPRLQIRDTQLLLLLLPRANRCQMPALPGHASLTPREPLCDTRDSDSTCTTLVVCTELVQPDF